MVESAKRKKNQKPFNPDKPGRVSDLNQQRAQESYAGKPVDFSLLNLYLNHDGAKETKERSYIRKRLKDFTEKGWNSYEERDVAFMKSLVDNQQYRAGSALQNWLSNNKSILEPGRDAKSISTALNTQNPNTTANNDSDSQEYEDAVEDQPVEHINVSIQQQIANNQVPTQQVVNRQQITEERKDYEQAVERDVSDLISQQSTTSAYRNRDVVMAVGSSALSFLGSAAKFVGSVAYSGAKAGGGIALDVAKAGGNVALDVAKTGIQSGIEAVMRRPEDEEHKGFEGVQIPTGEIPVTIEHIQHMQKLQSILDSIDKREKTPQQKAFMMFMQQKKDKMEQYAEQAAKRDRQLNQEAPEAVVQIDEDINGPESGMSNAEYLANTQFLDNLLAQDNIENEIDQLIGQYGLNQNQREYAEEQLEDPLKFIEGMLDLPKVPINRKDKKAIQQVKIAVSAMLPNEAAQANNVKMAYANDQQRQNYRQKLLQKHPDYDINRIEQLVDKYKPKFVPEKASVTDPKIKLGADGKTITAEEFATQMVKVIKYIGSISGDISLGEPLKKYAKVTSVFTPKLEQQEDTRFNLKSNAAFKIREC